MAIAASRTSQAPMWDQLRKEKKEKSNERKIQKEQKDKSNLYHEREK